MKDGNLFKRGKTTNGNIIVLENGVCDRITNLTEINTIRQYMTNRSDQKVNNIESKLEEKKEEQDKMQINQGEDKTVIEKNTEETVEIYKLFGISKDFQSSIIKDPMTVDLLNGFSEDFLSSIIQVSTIVDSLNMKLGTDLRGREHSLRDFIKNKLLFLIFWAEWATPLKQIIFFNDLCKPAKLSNVNVVGIVMGGRQRNVEEFIRKNNILFPILMDTNYTAAKTFRVKGVPETFVINQDGTIINKFYVFNIESHIAMLNILPTKIIRTKTFDVSYFPILHAKINSLEVDWIDYINTNYDKFVTIHRKYSKNILRICLTRFFVIEL
ncbi:MAG: TlpA family protein disulfide reductase [Candidatus Brocadiaceae bacterium]|nr:TlpA family protein disulfide reductase [Candidatus Brocadiaceae bacterium]